MMAFIFSLFIFAVILFMSENVVKGLEKYEKKFIKTNKLRHDWN